MLLRSIEHGASTPAPRRNERGARDLIRLQEFLRIAPKRTPKLPASFERLASIGIASDDPVVVRRQRFTNMYAFASAANVLTHNVVFCFYGLHGLAPLVAANTVFLLAFLSVPFLHRVGAGLGAHVVSGLSVAAILCTLVMLGRDSQIYVYFALSGIILFMFGVENPAGYVPWFVVALLGLTVSLPLVADGLLTVTDPVLLRIVSSNAMINAAVVNALIIYFVLSTLRTTELALEEQYDRTSTLMSTLLPASIVERLTATPERRIADRIDGLTVLFADLAGFTRAAHGLPPEEVIDYLDHLVRLFDELCETSGAEKIKTIGDSYMAVGGLDGNTREGAAAIGRLALSMLEAQDRQLTLGNQRLSLRVGIHIGSATAGVIGDRRFSYDVWGDAVNIASRMESHGLPGRIHVSDDYRTAAADLFDFETRGTIDVRGVGAVRTWFLSIGKGPG
jgi:adenylate cyclase